MGPTWGPPGGDRTQVGPMLAPWILLSGLEQNSKSPWRTLWGGDGLNTSGLRDWRDVCLALDVIIVLGIYFGVELHSCKIVTCNYQSMSRLQRQFIETAVEFRTWVRNCIRHETTDAIIHLLHYDDVIMTMLASQITSLAVVYSIVYSGVNQRKHQSSASLAFVREIHRGPVNFPHKWPVTRKMFPFDDVIMT